MHGKEGRKNKINGGYLNAGSKLTKYERYSIILTVVSLAIALLSIYISFNAINISSQNSKDLTNFTMQQQVSFDKHAAALQFRYEIESLYYKLVIAAANYHSNGDLSYKGKEVRIDYKGLNLIEVRDESGGSIPYLLIFVNDSFESGMDEGYNQEDLRNGTIHQMRAASISENYTIGDPLPQGSYEVPIPQGNLTFPIMPGKLYDETGMYYVYIRDIPKFSPKLSNDLNIFYHEIITAEADRKYIQDHLDICNPNNYSWSNAQYLKGPYFSAYMNMRTNIMKAFYSYDTIIHELEEEEKL